jgi:hypothetical protein
MIEPDRRQLGRFVMTAAEAASEIRRGRLRLPNRRGHELLDFEHGGIRYTAGAGKSLRFGVSITTGGFENWTAHFALSNFISALVV